MKGNLHEKIGNSVITHLLTDSRKVYSPEVSLFFAIEGERFDGHDYILTAYDEGVRNFVVNNTKIADFADLDANVIGVQDTLISLQTLAAFHRRQFDIDVIGITGSNGKTIIKEWLNQLLSPERNIVRSPKSYNSQIGVPLSVWQLDKEHDLGIFEAGMSKPGEMVRLEKIIKPTIGIFSNLLDAHSSNFQNDEQQAEEKLKLFEDAKLLVYSTNYESIDKLIRQDLARTSPNTLTWGKKGTENLVITGENHLSNGTEITGKYQGIDISITIPFDDKASIENAIHCWLLMLHLNYDQEEIRGRMLTLHPVIMRLELKEGINNCSVINDTYNSDVGSLEIALDFLNQQKQHSRRTLILSDILQTGKDKRLLYRQVADLIRQKKVNKLIGVGTEIGEYRELFNGESDFYPSTEEFLKTFTGSAFRDETILLKGARTFGFERISRLLQQKAHETVLEVDLTAAIHNLNFFKSLLAPGVKLMAMVKAFSYGSGSFEIANMLQFHKVDYLAVAYADEGAELRKAGITMPIMVINPEEHSLDTMIKYKLEPEIYNFRVLDMLEESIERGMQKGQQKIRVHIKLDTGMHRLGFENEDIGRLRDRIISSKDIQVASVFTHLAASDDHDHDGFTKKQIDTFKEMSEYLLDDIDYPVIRHVLNSAGISRFSDAQFDMVRLGIGMYGISGDPAVQKKLQNVCSLKTGISQVKTVKAGETIGYNRRGRAEKDITIATIPVGYADGIDRGLGNGKGTMLVNGRKVYTIGDICMDMCMLDVTGISVNEGDEVVVFGDGLPIAEMAKALNTIPYEVLTGVSRRVKRVYYQE